MCGLFGYFSYGESVFNSVNEAKELVRELAITTSIRGTDATGIAYMLDGVKMSIEKSGVAANKFNRYCVPKDTKVVMGHVRNTTQGSEKFNYNNHPFKGLVKGRQFALAHNGIIYNDRTLQKSNGFKTAIETDSYVAVQLIEKEGHLSTKSIQAMAEKVKGTFCFTILSDANTMWIVKKDNPLILAHFPSLDLYVYASTQDILLSALLYTRFGEYIYSSFIDGKLYMRLIEIPENSIFYLDQKGRITKTTFTPQKNYGGVTYSYCDGWENYHTPPTTAGFRIEKLPTAEEELIADLIAEGFSREEIDSLIDGGYTPEEIRNEYAYTLPQPSDRDTLLDSLVLDGYDSEVLDQLLCSGASLDTIVGRYNTGTFEDLLIEYDLPKYSAYGVGYRGVTNEM